MAEEKKELTRFDPFRDLGALEPFGSISSRLGRLLEDAFGERAPIPAVRAPAVDVTETDGEYVISAEIPGVKRDDLTVECKDGVLTIRGEKKSEREETKEKARLLERGYGAFTRSFTLPQDADVDRVQASFRDGVLRIQVQKRPEAKPKSVVIKSG